MQSAKERVRVRVVAPIGVVPVIAPIGVVPVIAPIGVVPVIAGIGVVRVVDVVRETPPHHSVPRSVLPNKTQLVPTSSQMPAAPGGDRPCA